MNLKHLHFYVDYRLLIILCGLLLFTFAARAQDVPPTPPVDDNAAIVGSILDALIVGGAAYAPAVLAITALLKMLLKDVKPQLLALVVTAAVVALDYFARRRGVEAGFKSILEWFVAFGLPGLVALFGSGAAYNAARANEIPVLGYKPEK